MGYFLFIIFGYLSGSILFARLIPKFFCHIDVCEISEDHNPGTFNVFRHVGVGLGILVILLELAKGFVPVFLAGRCLDMERAVFGLVLAAPVLGHGWPLWDLKGGGKSIAVSFGVLLGLFPHCGPVIMLAVFYLLFSLVIVIGPHFFRSVITYLFLCGYSVMRVEIHGILVGVVLISLIVVARHMLKYQGEQLQVRLCRQKENI